MAKVCLCGCGYPVFSNKYAQYCQNKRTDEKWLKKSQFANRKSISPISKKKAEELKIYRVKRDKYLAEHTECEVKDCRKPSNHIHHMNGRNGSMLHNEKYFMAVGPCCHPVRIHEDPSWARAMGYLI
jgi:hypothetical protein